MCSRYQKYTTRQYDEYNQFKIYFQNSSEQYKSLIPNRIQSILYDNRRNLDKFIEELALYCELCCGNEIPQWMRTVPEEFLVLMNYEIETYSLKKQNYELEKKMKELKKTKDVEIKSLQIELRVLYNKMKDIQNLLLDDYDSVKMKDSIQRPVRQTNALSPSPSIEKNEEIIYKWDVPCLDIPRDFNKNFCYPNDEDDIFISPSLVSEIDKLCCFDD